MFEQALERSMFTQDSEKTYIDKILGRQEVDRIRELIKKSELKREELLELLYLISGTESKLLNYGEWDRYVLLKFFVWIREFIKVAELLYDYKDFINKKKVDMSERSKQLFKNCERLIEHNAKFLIDLYFNIARTTLSLGATGFMEILKNKYEMSYPGFNPYGTPINEKTDIWGRPKR